MLECRKRQVKKQQTAHNRVLDLERPVRQSAISALSDGPKSSGKLDPQSPPHHRGCLCLGLWVLCGLHPAQQPQSAADPRAS